jgi:hypothetical protein
LTARFKWTNYILWIILTTLGEVAPTSKSHSFYSKKFSNYFVFCRRARWAGPTSHSNTPSSYPFVNSFDRSRLTARHRWVRSREMTRHMTIPATMHLPTPTPPGAGVCEKGVLPSHLDASRNMVSASPSPESREEMRSRRRRRNPSLTQTEIRDGGTPKDVNYFDGTLYRLTSKRSTPALKKRR